MIVFVSKIANLGMLNTGLKLRDFADSKLLYLWLYFLISLFGWLIHEVFYGLVVRI